MLRKSKSACSRRGSLRKELEGRPFDLHISTRRQCRAIPGYIFDTGPCWAPKAYATRIGPGAGAGQEDGLWDAGPRVPLGHVQGQLQVRGIAGALAAEYSAAAGTRLHLGQLQADCSCATEARVLCISSPVIVYFFHHPTQCMSILDCISHYAHTWASCFASSRTFCAHPM